MSNQSLTGNPVRLSGLLAGAAAMLVFPFLSSCRHDDPNAERPEFVEVYEHPDSLTPLSAASVSVRKGEATFYVKTNVEVTPRWQDAETKPWASVTRFEKIKDDLYELQLTYAKRYNIPYYTRRSGTLMLTAPDLSLGSYLPVHQGLTARLSSDMSWSKYGSSDPRKLDGKLSSEWSATDKNRGWVGEGVGAGIGAGYVMPITKTGRWRLEMGVQLGYFRCKYDPYKYENPVNPDYHDNLYYYKWTDKPEFFKKRQYRWNWLGPTRIGITLTYDLLYRKIQSKGVGLKSTERRVEP